MTETQPQVGSKALRDIKAEIFAADVIPAFDWLNEDHLDLLWEMLLGRRRQRILDATTALDVAEITAKADVSEAKRTLERERLRWIPLEDQPKSGGDI